ncbi:MAG: thiamine pyrophosphate-dependent enzyme, partial [Solirubrobacteraceae bacterium]
VAASGSGEVVLLLGDLTLAHDIGGLLAARRLGLKLTIVLLNNDGGGIFNFLPVASQGEVFEQHIATPTGLDFAQAAALYGCRHEPVDSLDGLAGALMTALAGSDTTIIEIHTNRVANRQLHLDVESAAARALRSSA